MVELKLPATDDELHRIQGMIEDQLSDEGCPESVRIAVLIAVEEIFVNIAHYAYEGRSGEAIVQFETTRHRFEVTFKDHGIPYDPLAKEDPDITLPAQDRTIGGLGIFMVKETMDKVSYEYKDGWNIFVMSKEF